MGCGCTKFVGSLLVSPGSTLSVYSKPQRRGGASGLATFELLQVNSAVDLRVTVEHRNTNQSTSAWTPVGDFGAGIRTAGVYSKDLSGFKGWYRFAFQFDTGTGGEDTALVSAIQIMFRP